MEKLLTPRQGAALAGLLGFIATWVLEAPTGLSTDAWRALGLTWLMAVFWIAEVLPLAVTALLPILLAPTLGLSPVDSVTRSYAHPLIFLFLGGFILGMAMERWRLHERIALGTLSILGGTPARELAGFMLATAFLSMWVSNTATAIMMLPIALSVVHLRGAPAASEGNPYAVALLLGIAYAASIGGIATLIGTPPNALLAAYLSDQHGIAIGFARWMLIGVPVALTMLALAWFWLAFAVAKGATAGTDQPGTGGKQSHAILRQRLAELGALTRMEWRVALVFCATALAWIFQPLLARAMPGAGITDTGIAIACAILLHLLPAGDGKGSRLMDWETSQRLPWGVLLLFGGGLALAGIIQDSGLAKAIAEQLSVLAGVPVLLAIGVVTLTVIFLTEVTSNTATTAAFLPLLGALALSIGLPVEALVIPAAIAASCAFMLPVATPPNAIVFGSGELSIKQMASAGLVLNLAGLLAVTLAGGLLVQWGIFS
ncbi:DASS family sodium-coupled anion symporter [Marinimicrobium sp. ABcell2]|uniref:SLC13 family permease n=1 Tax=Marinimicrobium sp. ABcell2 TaxID=3069751 RepID=UPI0027B6B5B9|nr:DASS family sodium-coupled anion symporter [Marinimicrobium sp. ABcell2]MDQ2076862.1 DASS family sodium-coupled anion symporter [Marinimicrobium sp. ABcell2]